MGFNKGDALNSCSLRLEAKQLRTDPCLQLIHFTLYYIFKIQILKNKLFSITKIQTFFRKFHKLIFLNRK